MEGDVFVGVYTLSRKSVIKWSELYAFVSALIFETIKRINGLIRKRHEQPNPASLPPLPARLEKRRLPAGLVER